MPPLTLDALGHDFARPECVLGTPSGDVYVSDWRGGVSVVRHDGTVRTWRGPDDRGLRPNGIALTRTGDFVVANLGDAGGVWRVARDGSIEPVLDQVDGVPIPPANFVTVDAQDRMWISVSTRRVPRQEAWRERVGDGFVIVADHGGPRIVADGLGYTNEVRPDATGTWLYVVETFGRRLVRFPIRPTGDLGAQETVVTLDGANFPDGFAFDEEGGIWLTSLVTNRLFRFHDDRLEVVFEDTNAAYADLVERAFIAGAMNASHLGPIPGTRLQHLTSVAFGGADRRTGYLGSLHGTSVYRFQSPVTGAEPPHWGFPLP